MVPVASLSLPILIIIFLLCAAAITWAGTKLAVVAERLAEATGLGQAIIGAVAIGISTSLAGSVLSCYSAYQGHSELAIGNAMGGLPAQMAFLAIADITYRRVNIEHGAASVENLGQGTFLFILLALPLLAMTFPAHTIYAIHPATVILIGTYFAGLKMIYKVKEKPMWHPRKTLETQVEKDEQTDIADEDIQVLVFKFLGLAAVLASAGFILTEVAIEISGRTNLSQTMIGGVFTSVCTSLPELVTTIAAVRRKALNLAVGNIIGGNSFDVLFLAGADIFYREGSIYHQINDGHITIITTAMLMTGVLILGLLRRQEKGPAGIGFESVVILGLYALLCGFLFTK